MDPKLLALQLFDKVILVGFAGWLVMSGVGMLQQPEELSLKDDLTKNLTEIGAHMKGTTVTVVADPGWRNELESQLKAETVPAAAPGPGWVVEKRPGFLYQHYVKVENYKCIHLPPSDVNADGAVRGQVTVRWRLAANEYVIASYEVHRRRGAEGPWTTVATMGPGSVEYVDTGVAARSEYFYKIVSVAEPDREAPVVQRYDLKLKDEETRMESSETGPIKTQADVFVLPVTVTVVEEADIIANPNAKESAYVRVHKWDPESSSFKDATFTVKVGDPIGEKKKLRGGKEFDFTTGAVLDDTSYENRPHPTIPNHTERAQVIRIRFADGSTADFNDKDKPAELGGGS
jgi:hypothetical protein